MNKNTAKAIVNRSENVRRLALDAQALIEDNRHNPDNLKTMKRAQLIERLERLEKILTMVSSDLQTLRASNTDIYNLAYKHTLDTSKQDKQDKTPDKQDKTPDKQDKTPHIIKIAQSIPVDNFTEAFKIKNGLYIARKKDGGFWRFEKTERASGKGWIIHTIADTESLTKALPTKHDFKVNQKRAFEHTGVTNVHGKPQQ